MAVRTLETVVMRASLNSAARPGAGDDRVRA
jgi:hypothetical protein